MIHPAIHIIEKELSSKVPAKVGNVAEILNNNNNQPDEIIISLINIEENRISADPNNFVRNDTSIIMKNPAIHLNLTLLFTSVKDALAYEIGLQKIQKVIEFFQQKYVFNHSNTADLDPGIEKLILEMVSLNLEQLHQLWSMLGGKYHPSVVYRMRMITIDTDEGVVGPSIKEIEAGYKLINSTA